MNKAPSNFKFGRAPRGHPTQMNADYAALLSIIGFNPRLSASRSSSLEFLLYQLPVGGFSLWVTLHALFGGGIRNMVGERTHAA